MTGTPENPGQPPAADEPEVAAVATGSGEPRAPRQREQDAASEPATPVPPDDVGTEPIAQPSPAHRRPRTAFGRQWWTKVAIVGLCGLLGLGLAAQLRRNETDAELTTARQSDLVRILDELDSREQRLRSEINDLEERRRNLSTAAEGSQSVLDDLQERAEELGILAGTAPAEGTGVQLVFRAGAKPLRAEVILDAVEELRGAGAEAMQIGGGSSSPVRIVASTAFLDADDDLLVGDRRLSGPYTLLAVGDSQTMRAALAIPGGVVDSVEDAGGTVLITTPQVVSVTATRSPATPRYATPVN